MATEGAIQEESYEADDNLSAYQFHFVKFSGDRTVGICAAVTDKPCGILQNVPGAAAAAAIVMISGESKFVSSGTTTAGDLISTYSDGHGITLTPGAAGPATDTTQYIVGSVSVGAHTGEIGTANIDCSSPRRAA